MNAICNVADILFIEIETSAKEYTEDIKYAWRYLTRRINDEQKQDEMYNKVAAMKPEFGYINSIIIGIVVGKVLVYEVISGEEKQILEMFNSGVRIMAAKNKGLTFCAPGIKSYDIPYLHKRLIINGIKPAEIIDNSGIKPWEVRALDIIDLWQMGSRYKTSLVGIAAGMGIKCDKSNSLSRLEASAKIIMRMKGEPDLSGINKGSVIPEIGLIDNIVYYDGEIGEIVKMAAGKTIKEKEKIIELLKAAMWAAGKKLPEEVELKILSA